MLDRVFFLTEALPGHWEIDFDLWGTNVHLARRVENGLRAELARSRAAQGPPGFDRFSEWTALR